MLADSELCEGLGSLRASLPTVETWVALGGGAPEGWCGVEAWLEGGSAGELRHRARPDDVLYQMYTSGTTGRPKGVLLTHRNVLTNCAQVSAGLSYAVEPGDRWLIVAPLFHAAAVITAFSCVAGGGCLVIQKGFDPRAVVDVAGRRRHRPHHARPRDDPGLPCHRGRRGRPLLSGGCEPWPTAARPLPSPRCCGPWRCSAATSTRVSAQTESSAGLTYLTELDHRAAVSGRPELLASCGQALPGTELRIVDPTGAPLPPGAVGEVVARGPQVMSGYWNRPEESATALRDGWLWTGDAGSLDELGYLTIHDRLRDMVVTGGENVYPREVENVLLRHPSVLDVAVIGVPDETWGEAVHAVVVVGPGATVDLDSLREFGRGGLAGFKLPSGVTVVEELPRNASGKVLKAELRRTHRAEPGRRVS